MVNEFNGRTAPGGTGRPFGRLPTRHLPAPQTLAMVERLHRAQIEALEIERYFDRLYVDLGGEA